MAIIEGGVVEGSMAYGIFPDAIMQFVTEPLFKKSVLCFPTDGYNDKLCKLSDVAIKDI